VFVAGAVTVGCFSCDGAGDAVGACARAEMPDIHSKPKTPNRPGFPGQADQGRLLMISISHWMKNLITILEMEISDLTSRRTEYVHAVPSIGMLKLSFLSAKPSRGRGKSQNQKLVSPTHSSGPEICFGLRFP
jgi:hypothetical protein